MSIPKSSQNLLLDTKRHSFAHIMAAAVKQMFPEAQFGIGPVIDTGCYYDFILPRTLIPEDLPLIEKHIKDLLKKNLSYKVQEFSIEEAITLFEKHNQPLKVELLNDLRTKGTTSMSEEEKADFGGNDEIKIRPTLESDIEEIVDINHRAWLKAYVNEEHDITVEDIENKDWSQKLQRWQDKFRKDAVDNSFTYFVAEKNGQIVGFIILKNDPQAPWNQPHALYVDPNFQNQGVGSRLMDKAVEYFGNQKDMIADVVSYNNQAIKFYEKLGFKYLEKAENFPVGNKFMPIQRMILKKENININTKLPKITVYRIVDENTGEILFEDLCKGPHIADIGEIEYLKNYISKEGKTIKLRTAKIEDIPNILEVQKAAMVDAFVGENYGITKEMIEKDYTEEKANRLIEYFKTSKYFVAEYENKIIGVSSAPNDGIIRTVWIKPEYQSQGIGKELVTMAIRVLSDKKVIKLETGRQKDEQALKFYQSLGFELTGKESKIKFFPEQINEVENIELVMKKEKIKEIAEKNSFGFKLDKFSGSYWRGDQDRNIQMQRIYALVYDTEVELQEFINNREEAKKRDHRVVGKQLELFTFSDIVGAGLPLWLEKGATVRRVLERFIVEEEIRRGYKHVYTPDMANLGLYEKSGHYPYYKDSMYAPIEIDNDKYMLRPMTCPHHFQIYLDKPRSYRELPMRIAELAKLYRYEDSGALSGLIRVRSFCLADSHIVCTPEQVKQEVNGALDLIEYCAEVFGLTKGQNYRYRLSLGDRNDDKKYFKDDNAWGTAEQALREVLVERSAPFYEAEAEAAFYGPKIDIQMTNVNGKEDTAFTVQYDFVMPKRFNLSYFDSEQNEKEAVVVHRSSIGAIERLFAFLVEFYGGRFPLWLAPTQVKILTINDKVNDYVAKVQEVLSEVVLMKPLKYNELRYELDDRSESLGKKIREAEMEKVPVILIVGPKDAENDQVSVRTKEKEEKVLLSELKGYLEQL